MLYIRLFHGRTDPHQDMDDWGSDGPIFGPYEYEHTTYAWDIKLGKPGGNCDELYVHEGMVYYDGVYYGDWTVFGLEMLEKGRYAQILFAQEKAYIPK
jgi:hypothetical protein